MTVGDGPETVDKCTADSACVEISPGTEFRAELLETPRHSEDRRSERSRDARSNERWAASQQGGDDVAAADVGSTARAGIKARLTLGRSARGRCTRPWSRYDQHIERPGQFRSSM